MLNKEQLNDFKKAGQIAGRARDFGVKEIQKGKQTIDILDSIEEFIFSQGGQLAFPAQLSFNTIAAHQCSDSEDKSTILESDLVKLDVGVHINGLIGDTAVSINLDGQYKELINASKQALNKAIDYLRPGVMVGEVGNQIQQTINSFGFVPVKNLSGHGLGKYQIHTDPQIPNISLSQSKELKEGMTVACEPFATNGKGLIADGGEPTVFSPVPGAPIRTRTQFVKEIAKEIETYNGLPFASRWLVRKFGLGKTRFALKELERIGAIHAHPPLREVGKGMVSQAEHSFYITDNKPIITTKIDDD
jgi:methionyl aminopeptidase